MEMASARKRNDTTQRRCDSLGDRFRLFSCLLFDSQRQKQTHRGNRPFAYLLIELTLGTLSESQMPSAIRRSRISQANMVGA